LDKKKIIKEETENIMNFLGLSKKALTYGEELENVIKIYKYVIQNINSDLNYREPKANSKQERYMDSLLIALINNPGVYTTNSILFKHLLDMSGTENLIVKSKSKVSGANAIANLVKIGSEYYYFLPTLEKEMLNEVSMPDNLFMRCAALGKKDYDRLYFSSEILEDIDKPASKELPKNISEESLLKTIVNGINFRLPSLKRKSSIKSIDEFDEPELI